MQRKDQERQLAQLLRSRGLSVRRIANELDVALSSVSVWVRDVPLPDPPAPAAAVAAKERSSQAGGSGSRRCGRCRQILPLRAFNRSGAGHQHWCRACFGAYFAGRRELHRTQVEAARRARRRRAREHVAAYLRDHRCADCGESDPLVLEFDHCRGEKRRNVCDLVAEAASVKRLNRELELCDVVCASCHRRRTAMRGGWFRVTGIPRPTWTPGQVRNQRYLLDLLRASACIDCGAQDPVILEFDHVRGKRAEVTKLAASCSAGVLEREVARCVVRCVNCHRRKSLRAAAAWRTAE